MKDFNREKIKEGVKLILEGLNVEIKKDLKDTPQRVAEMYEEILFGQHKDPAKELEVILEHKHDEIILVKNISLYSLCEHHLLPFFGKVHIAYLPERKITGLSKIVRVVEVLSRRLQVQERLTMEIAEIIMEKLKPKGVMVVIEAEHLCMSMRGVKKPGSITTTSVVKGVFRKNQKTREEALNLIFSSTYKN